MATEPAQEHAHRPWRGFPAEGSPPDLRAQLPKLPRDVVDRLLKSARRDLHRWLLDELKEREAQQRRSVRGFRPGVWPHDRLVNETFLLHRDHRLIAASVAVMLLEQDDAAEQRLAEALDEFRGRVKSSTPAFVEHVQAKLPTTSNAAVLAELAWAFRDYGKGGPVSSPKSSPSPSAPTRAPQSLGEMSQDPAPDPKTLASELDAAHAALTTAMVRLRDVVGALDAAREVRREEAEETLETALRAASRVRAGLAAVALLSPSAVAEAPTSADQLARLLARAAESLAALATPTGRVQLERLVAELRRGRITATNQMRRRTLERARSAAVAEIDEGLLGSADVDGFPGPTDESPWLRWYWSTPSESGRVEAALEGHWEKLFDFLGSVQESDWAEAPDAAVVETSIPKAASPEPEAAPEPVVPSPPETPSPPIPAVPVEPEPQPVMASLPVASPTPPAPVAEAVASESPGPAAASNTAVEPTLAPLPRTSTSPGTRVALHVPTLEQFRKTHWVDRDDNVVAAPWERPEFAGKAFAAFLDAVNDHDWARARLMLQALERRHFLEAPLLADFDAAVALSAGRWPPPEDEQIEAVARLRQLHDQSALQSDARHRLIVALVLAAPSAMKLLSAEEVEAFTVLTGFCARLQTFLGAWAEAARALPDPFATLASQLRSGRGVSLDDLKARDDAARNVLKSRLKELHLSAGNRIQRTHCRVAWDEFVTEAHPHFDAAIASPEAPTTRVEIGRMKKKAAKIFDRNGAKFGDRNSMDRAVDMLIDAANARFREFDAWRAATTATSAKESFSPAVTQLAVSPTLADASPDEPWILRLFTGRTSNKIPQPTSVLSPAFVTRHPWLLSTWPLGADALRNADVAQCLDPLSAAAHILYSAPVDDVDDLRMWVFNEAPSLLAYFSDLNDRERSVIEDVQRKQRDALDGIIARLRRCQVELAELADRDADSVTKIILELEAESDSGKQNHALINAWGRFVLESAQEHLDETLQRVSNEAERAGLSSDEVSLLRSQRRYADLHVRAGRPASTTVARVRATPFRPEARKLWPEPRVALARLASDPAMTGNEAAKTLLREWSHTSRHNATPLGADKQQQLREHFAEVVFEATARQRRKKIKWGKLAVRIACSDVAEWLNVTAQTPTFLPQLHKYSDLIVKVVPVAVNDRGLQSKIAELGEDGAITIVLAPGLSEQAREHARRGVRVAPGRPIALLDDLDLCRLLNPGGQQPGLVEALVELCVEQQAWDEFGPYEVQEGQHVRMEMYVGRRSEADRLVTGTTYSRVFSGRRLGKTALLRYVEHKYDGWKMPSGNTLRVLYVPVVGLGSEPEVVDEIVGKLEAVTGVEVPRKESPRDTLKAAVNAAIAARRDESFLIFLDESDTFFENQTSAAAAGDEVSLSWAMRDIEKLKDARQHPRVRFVVCGYRATNRSEGAWGNWGDVLLLNPLDPADAVQLVRGPLARLGIDAEEQADAIAFRCGYQPAVIIYFCVRLLDELSRRTAFTERERRVVRPEDVVSVFQLPSVQDRVRETCWLNFVGDPLGQLTFAAFLAESAELAPGTPIDDAPQRILSHVLRELAGKQMDGFGVGTWRDVGGRHLRDLVKRALLTEADHHPVSLRLRFPHQLPILLQESPQLRIRDALHRLGGTRPGSARPQWLVPEDVLENARWCLGIEGAQLGVQRVVFGSHWCQPLLAGLKDRLPHGQLLSRFASPADLDGPPEGALVGGVGLLRAALRRQTVEVVRLGRLSTDAIEGYFKRERGIEFSSPGALTSIMAATSGIPAVVDGLAAQFEEGATVSADQLEEAIRATTNGIPSLARKLRAGADHVRLEAREIELLHLLFVASEHAPDALREFLRDPELLRQAAQQSSSLAAIADTIAPLGPGDSERITLLLTLGLLPRRPVSEGSGSLSEVAPIAAPDALASILAHLPVTRT